MFRKSHGIVAIMCCCVCSLGWADTLKLKNGSTIIGTYAGGSDRDIAFRVGTSVQHYDIADVASLTFDSSAITRSTDDAGFASRKNQTQPEYQPGRPTYSNSLTIPSGTRLVVRTIDPIDSDKNHVGDKFQATLEEAVYVNDVVVAPKGA
ncbi:MAG TPA: hypothetical protein VJA94_06685, partial [Candidatus Angelobacter sp.]